MAETRAAAWFLRWFLACLQALWVTPRRILVSVLAAASLSGLLLLMGGQEESGASTALGQVSRPRALLKKDQQVQAGRTLCFR